MKKRVLSLFLAFAMILGLMPAVTAAETVKIGTAEALFDFADRVNGTGDYSVPEPDLSAVLTGDITVAEEWVPIVLKAAPYAGIFDGGGYSITLSNGITYRGTNERYGLFGTVSGTIQNLTVKGSIDFSNQAGNVGGIAGYLNGGKVQACLNEASIAGKNNVGGIVGNTESVPGTLNGRQRRGIIVRIRLIGIGTGINAVFTGSRTWRLGKKLIYFRFGERNGRVSADNTRKSFNHHIR